MPKTLGGENQFHVQANYAPVEKLCQVSVGNVSA